MRRGFFAVAGLLLLTACGGGGTPLVSGGDVPQAALTPTSSVTPTVSPSHAPSPSARPSARVSPSATHSVVVRPTPMPTPTPTHRSAAPSSTPTHAVACSGTGSTTTIREVAGDRFSPSTVTVNVCDYVKAVYADSTGTPHTFTGNGWDSGNMSSSGQSYMYRFTSKGTFNFFCSYHQSIGMTGTVTVS